MNRRDFIKKVSANAALGGGALMLAAEKADGAIPKETTQAKWGNPWRPPAPMRLSDVTHALAERAISGEHGRSMKNAEFRLDDNGMAVLSPDMRYAHAVKLVAEKAPLRILPGERIVGSATLEEAPAHATPVAGVTSTSHTTIGFDRVLKIGYKGLRQQIAERRSRGSATLPERGSDFLNAMEMCLDAAEIWHRRYMELLTKLASQSEGSERENYLEVLETLRNVPENPPTTFHEAVQSLWFMYAFQRLLGNWSGIGRIDEMLGPYLEKDLRDKRITLDEARELIAHFWIKGCEWIGAFDTRGSGDAQHYQNIVLSGVNSDGWDVTNEVTYLVLDVVEELHISDFPIAMRISKRTPQKLLRRVAEVQRHGGGIVAIYNEDVVLDALVKFGYPLEEARKFANDGCWEVLIPGKTTFIYVPFDMLTMLHQTLALHEKDSAPPAFADFKSLYAAFMGKVKAHIDWHNKNADGFAQDGYPTPLISLFVEDCIERARGYHDRGSHYNVIAPHAGGMANVANSLLVIKKLIFEERYLTLPEFVSILRDDWKDQEPLRQLVLNRFAFYGNDNDEADAMMTRVFNDYTDLVWQVPERNGVLRPAGISTFGREIEWSRGPNAGRMASPDGHHRGEILATNCSPSPGTDKLGPTAFLKSCCKLDFTRVPNGATVELKMHPESVKGERGIEALAALMRGFVKMGGWFLHVDVVDSTMLLDAQRHPEKYPNLSVRVAGWSARFATLDKNWQDMVIGRTQQYC
jgi:formate C-acetyltransferase